jgi:hypothetical protein
MTLDKALLELERQDKIIKCKFKKIELECDFLETDEPISLDYNLYWVKSLSKYINTILLPQLDKYEINEFVYFYNRYKVSPQFQGYNDKQLDLLAVLKQCITHDTCTHYSRI